MPQFRINYANFLRNEKRAAEYKAWNVNLDYNLGVGPLPIEPIIFYAHQSAGKYDISSFGEKVGDVYFPTSEHYHTLDGNGEPLPVYDELFDTPVASIELNDKTEELMIANCKEAENHPDHDC